MICMVRRAPGALFNVSVLHTATTRPTQEIRKTAQIYYGHRHRAPLANDSAIPATFWRDSPDAENTSLLRGVERPHAAVPEGIRHADR